MDSGNYKPNEADIVNKNGIIIDTKNKRFYANGQNIEINNYQGQNSETYGCTITWQVKGMYHSVNLEKDYYIFGGSNGNDETKANANITVNGGVVAAIFGGNLESNSTGDVKITINDGTITTGVWGGSLISGNVNDVEITINGGTIGPENNNANVINASGVNPSSTITGKSTIKINTANNPTINGGISKANKVLVNNKAVSLATIYLEESVNNDTASNKFFGVNAFTSFTKIAENFSKETKRIEVSGTVNEILPFAGISFALRQDLVISGSNDAVIDFANDSSIAFKKDSSFSKDVSITFENITLDARDYDTYIYFGSKDTGKVAVNVILKDNAQINTEVVVGLKSTVQMEAGSFINATDEDEALTILGKLSATGEGSKETAQIHVNSIDNQKEFIAKDTYIVANDIQVQRTATFTGDNTKIDVNNLTLDKEAVMTLNNGSQLNISEVNSSVEGQLNVNNSEVSIQNFTNNGNISLKNNSKLNVNNNFVNSNSITIDETSCINTNTIDNAGEIIIDVTDKWTGVAKVIKASSVIVDDNSGSIKVEEKDKDAGVRYKVDIANSDLIVYSVNTSKMFIDGKFDGDENEDGTDDIGKNLGNGRYFGINAFNDIATALVAAKIEDTTELDIAQGTYDESGNLHFGKEGGLEINFNEVTIQDAEIYFGTSVDENQNIPHKGAFKITGNLTSNSNIYFQGDNKEATFDINGNITSADNAVEFTSGKAVISKDSTITTNNFNVYTDVTNYGKIYSADDSLITSKLIVSGEGAGVDVKENIEVSELGQLVVEKGAIVATTGSLTIAKEEDNGKTYSGVLEVNDSTIGADNIDNAGTILLNNATVTTNNGFNNKNTVILSGTNNIAQTIEQTADAKVVILNDAVIYDNDKVEVKDGRFLVGQEVNDTIYKGTLNISAKEQSNNIVTINANIEGIDGESNVSCVNVAAGATLEAYGINDTKLNVNGTAKFTKTVYLNDGGTIAQGGVLTADGGIYVYSNYVVNGTMTIVANEAMGDWFKIGKYQDNKAKLTISGEKASFSAIDGNYELNSSTIPSIEEGSTLVVTNKGTFNFGGDYLYNDGTISLSKDANFTAENVANEGKFTFANNNTVNAIITGNDIEVASKAALVNDSNLIADLKLKGAFTIDNSKYVGTVTGNQTITLKGNVTINLTNGSKVKAITIAEEVTTLIDVTNFSNVTINGNNSSKLTAAANNFMGNKVNKVKLALTDIKLQRGETVNLNIDKITNITSVNGLKVCGNADSGYYVIDEDTYNVRVITEFKEINNQLVFEKISDENGNAERTDYSGNLDGLNQYFTVIAKANTAKLDVKKNTQVAAIKKTEGEDGEFSGITNITINKQASLIVKDEKDNLGVIEAIGSLTTNANSTIIAGVVTGTDKNTTVSIGKNSTGSFTSLDMKGGKNILTVGDNSQLNITGNLSNATTIKVGNGTVAKKASLTIGSISPAVAKNSITIGNYAEFILNGSIINSPNEDGKTGTTAIKAGSNSLVAIYGLVNEVESISTGNNTTTPTNESAYTFIVSSNLTGTSANNKYAFGKNSKITIGSVDMFEGNNSFTIGANSIAEIADGLLNVSTLKVDKAASLSVAKAFTGTKANITIGESAIFEVNAGSIDGVSKLTVGKYADVFVANNFNGNNATISLAQEAEMVVMGNLNYISKLTVGKVADLIVEANLTGSNKLTIALDQGAKATINNNVTNVSKLTLGKEAEFQITEGNFEGINATISLAQDAKLDINGSVTDVKKLTLGKDAEMSVSTLECDAATISLAQGGELKITSDVTNVSKLTLAKEAEMYVGGTIIGTAKKDSVSIGANSLLQTSGFESIESVTLAKDSILVVTNGEEDINLDEISGKWTNGTIYDVQKLDTTTTQPSYFGQLYGKLYGNEWDVYAFEVDSDNNWDKLTVSGWLDGVTIKIAYQESGSDDWSIEEFIEESTNVGSIKNLTDGKYAIMVGRGSANFIKDEVEPDYDITINLSKSI